MVALTWGTTGSRFFETGLDRGVLYLPNVAGVAWPGLVSVNENVTGGEARPYYVDGFKYLNIQAAEDFGATIEAFSAPREFDVCDGRRSLAPGLFATQQVRKPFGFSYRTLVGNDVDGNEAGYKLHIVYNALTGAPSMTHKTLDSSANPATMSWDISTKAPLMSAARPTAHFVIDSRYVDSKAIQQIEGVLYGTSLANPRLPEVSELINMFNGSFTS